MNATCFGSKFGQLYVEIKKISPFLPRCPKSWINFWSGSIPAHGFHQERSPLKKYNWTLHQWQYNQKNCCIYAFFCGEKWSQKYCVYGKITNMCCAWTLSCWWVKRLFIQPVDFASWNGEPDASSITTSRWSESIWDGKGGETSAEVVWELSNACMCALQICTILEADARFGCFEMRNSKQHICAFMHSCICVFVYLCICVFVYSCICVSMSMSMGRRSGSWSRPPLFASIQHQQSHPPASTYPSNNHSFQQRPPGFIFSSPLLFF